MRTWIRSVIVAVWLPVAILALVASLFRTLLLEEEEEEGAGLVGGHDPGKRPYRPADLSEHVQAYLTTVGELIAGYSRAGKKRLRRFYAMSLTALACASGVPVAVAAQAPDWSVAMLGALAAVAQGGQQILQDQRLGTESHAMAVLLSQMLRRFRHSVGGTSGAAQRLAFEELVNEIERTLDTHGTGIIDIMRRTPSADQTSQRGTPPAP